MKSVYGLLTQISLTWSESRRKWPELCRSIYSSVGLLDVQSIVESFFTKNISSSKRINLSGIENSKT